MTRDGYEINNCSNCAIYVGNWNNDVKSGTGTCYDKHGNLIYHGNFANDRPTDIYPSGDGYSAYRFETINYNSGDSYVGETENGKRHGYGIYVWTNGNIWFGSWKEGNRSGNGIFILHNASWHRQVCNGDDCNTLASFNSSDAKNTPQSSDDNNNRNRMPDVVLTNDEMRLYNLIMAYRREKGLPTIPISKSLTYVAQLHVRNLDEYHKEGTKCNMHSWYGNGKWTNCCYTSDHAQAKCVWDKPRELTSYKGNGYEISFGGSGGYRATPEEALNGWKKSHGHNTTIINEGIWKNLTWNAIGIGIYKGYANVWFGSEEDEE